MRPSVALVIPWFGRWEPWSPLFFETVRQNPGLDVLLYTDADTSGITAPNVHVHAMTLSEYVDLVNDRLHLDFSPPDAYKLCDLRPLFGTLHEPELRSYDFYGWCDIDLILGDVRSFYTDAVLSRYDVLSTHRDRISGHFALFRNTQRNRSMYRRIYRWRGALANPRFVGIDEHGLTNAYRMTVLDKANEKFGWNLGGPLGRLLTAWRSRHMLLEERYTTPFVPFAWLDGTRDSHQPSEWIYEGGVVRNRRDGDRRFIYLHLMNFKSSRWRHDGTPAPWEGRDDVCRATPADMSNGIVINETGIHPLSPDTP